MLKGRGLHFLRILNYAVIDYAAASWAFAFAAISFYWAAGGTFGANSVGKVILSIAMSDRVLFSLVLWADGVAKTLLGLLALAFVQKWGKVFPKSFLLISSTVVGLCMAAYGFIELTVTGIAALLMGTGMISSPPTVDWAGIEGHLAIWDPYWLIGGILFMLMARSVHNQVKDQIRKQFHKITHMDFPVGRLRGFNQESNQIIDRIR